MISNLRDREEFVATIHAWLRDDLRAIEATPDDARDEAAQLKLGVLHNALLLSLLGERQRFQPIG